MTPRSHGWFALSKPCRFRVPIGRTAPILLWAFTTSATGVWMAPCSGLRERIQAYNLACGDPDGYSETITVTYLCSIAADIAGDDGTVTMAEQVARLASR